MRVLGLIGIVLALTASDGLCQSTSTFTREDTLSAITVVGVPAAEPRIVEPRIQVYQNFFNEIIGFSGRPFSEEVRFLELSETELHSMLTVTADLVAECRSLKKKAESILIEASKKAGNSGALAPAWQEPLRDLEKQRAQKILDHLGQLKKLLGEPRYEELDEFIQSGEPMFARPDSAPRSSAHGSAY